MTIKQILKINLILFILIILSTVGILLFNNYLYSPYDALNDLRETERESALAESEIPNTVLLNGNNFVEEYHKALEDKSIKNLKIVRAYTELDNSNYLSNYIIVDTKKNRVIANIDLMYRKDGNLEHLNITYREFNDEEFLLYNDTLINLKNLSLSPEIVEKIAKYSKENPKGEFNIENKYKYKYSYREPTAQFYTRIIESRWVYIDL